MSTKALALIVGAVLAVDLPAFALTRYVDVNSTNPVPPYTNWATAASVIQDAVDAAADGDAVLVTNGVYSTDFASPAAITVNNALNLCSVNGPEFTVLQHLSRIRPMVFLTNGATLSGFTVTSCGVGVEGCGSSSVVSNCIIAFNTQGARRVTLVDCTLSTNGLATGPFSIWPQRGGAAYQCMLINCYVTGNLASYGGAAAECILSNCTLRGNSAGRCGGGTYESTLNNCRLIGNSAPVGNLRVFHEGGGGAYLSVLNNCTLAENLAEGTGGGAGASWLTNCTLVGNIALTPSGWVGPGRGGGAVECVLDSCVLNKNFTDGEGGGAHSCQVDNCLLTGNSAGLRGGGATESSFNSCTIVGNSAADSVGGAAGWLTNCIVYFNAAPRDANWWSNSIINFTCTAPLPTNGSGNITNAPLFVDTNNWSDLRLRPDSPCIDAGNNDFVTWDTDLDGNPRIINGVVDMGAYEFAPLPPPTPSELVQDLIEMVNESDLRNKRPLLASLEAALASIERGNHNSATGQMGAFQNKVGAQVSKKDAALAMQLIEGAQQVMNALDDSPKMAGKIHSIKRHNGKMQMQIKGEAGKAYILEGSTNLVDWKPICVVRPDEEGNCDYEDFVAAKHQSRFYRVGVPE